MAAGRFEEVIASSDQILPKLAVGKRVKLADKKYLHAFVWGLKDTAEAALRGQRHDIIELEKVDWSEIDLARVSKHLKMNYPLRAHPLWDQRL